MLYKGIERLDKLLNTEEADQLYQINQFDDNNEKKMGKNFSSPERNINKKEEKKFEEPPAPILRKIQSEQTNDQNKSYLSKQGLEQICEEKPIGNDQGASADNLEIMSDLISEAKGKHLSTPSDTKQADKDTDGDGISAKSK
mmetsp:Transcript_15446/g.13485  ORF Transcript_15446/g.13485 Transcript_15446/m.13485 type:complete len:142 (+) Transcript_15446:319-744(+)